MGAILLSLGWDILNLECLCGCMCVAIHMKIVKGEMSRHRWCSLDWCHIVLLLSRNQWHGCRYELSSQLSRSWSVGLWSFEMAGWIVLNKIKQQWDARNIENVYLCVCVCVRKKIGKEKELESWAFMSVGEMMERHVSVNNLGRNEKGWQYMYSSKYKTHLKLFCHWF